jgi:hypothetical protein
MNRKNNIKQNIEETLNVTDSIKDIKVSPFFKDKTLDLLFAEKEVTQTTRFWFSPKLQLATLACVVIFNLYAFTKLKETTYNENVNQFAESYGLSKASENYLLN